MALDKLVDAAKLDADLTAVADAIREKGGTSEELQFPEGFVEAIDGMSGGSPEFLTLKVTNNTSKASIWARYYINSSNNKMFQVSQMVLSGKTAEFTVPRFSDRNIRTVMRMPSGTSVTVTSEHFEVEGYCEGDNNRLYLLKLASLFGADETVEEITINETA